MCLLMTLDRDVILLMLMITGVSHPDNATVKAILRPLYVLILTYHFLWKSHFTFDIKR